MSKTIQDLYVEKIKIYDLIINELRNIDFQLMLQFEEEFNTLDSLSNQIEYIESNNHKDKIMTMRL